MNLTINIPDDFYADLSNIAGQLKQTPEQTILLALSQFFQTDTVETAIEGIERRQDNTEPLVDFPELKEELGLDIKFHPTALEELEEVIEEDQIEILEQLINRIAAPEEDLEGTLDLVLQEENDHQVILSGFEFGEIVYQTGPHIVIYHIALDDDEDFEDDASFDEDDEHELQSTNTGN